MILPWAHAKFFGLMDKVREISLKKYPLKDFPLRAGDSAKVFLRVKEGNKERIQLFEGIVLKIQGQDFNRSFTVRKISSGVGVEKTIPLSSPNIANVEILSRSKVRRARLFYLRKLKGRAARLDIAKDKKQELKSGPAPSPPPAKESLKVKKEN